MAISICTIGGAGMSSKMWGNPHDTRGKDDDKKKDDKKDSSNGLRGASGGRGGK